MAADNRVLLIDDDAELCSMMTEYLSGRGFRVEVVDDGARGLQQAEEGHYDLVVLDVMLPTLDGFEVLRRLRGGGHASLPVIMLTAHGDETDRIVGLELGADDYLPKPFNPRELLARIKAILRRASSRGETDERAIEPPGTQLIAGDLALCVEARQVRRHGDEVELTAIEFDLLRVLMQSTGKVVTRETLAHDALERRLLPLDRTLDIHISKLRHKLWPDGSGLERLKTVRGIGYILVSHAEIT